MTNYLRGNVVFYWGRKKYSNSRMKNCFNPYQQNALFRNILLFTIYNFHGHVTFYIKNFPNNACVLKWMLFCQEGDSTPNKMYFCQSRKFDLSTAWNLSPKFDTWFTFCRFLHTRVVIDRITPMCSAEEQIVPSQWPVLNGIIINHKSNSRANV